MKNRACRQTLRGQQGIALVVTLLILAIITAMAVEFAYGVYTGTNNLYNWRDSQRLSLMAKSGVNVSARFLLNLLGSYSYSYPGTLDIPVENPFEDFEGVITVRIEDETSKFNINSLVYDRGVVNPDAYASFKKLLEILSLDEKVADRVADWIDTDSDARMSGSEENAKNSALVSIDELLLIPGISRKDYDTLLPYITVYGDRNSYAINVNGAEIPVLMSIYDKVYGSFPITEDDAKRIVSCRDNKPFEDLGQLINCVDVSSVSDRITYKGVNFSIKSVAESGGVKRIIETVLNTGTDRFEYWKEY